jgi:hypothetical protein
MHESLMRSFSRFMILAVCAMIVMLICCSFAAGQEPVKADDFRPRPNPTIIPNGIDVPKLIDSQPQPHLVGWPKLNCYLLIVADSDLTIDQKQTLNNLFRGFPMDGVGKPIDIANEIEQRVQISATNTRIEDSLWWLKVCVSLMLILIGIQVAREFMRWRAYRDMGLVK